MPAIPERSQQGVLNAIFVGRAPAHPQGLGSHRAFRTDDGRPLVDTGRPLVFDGNSQGGALVAASPDIRTAVLGLTGMNYGLLLNRSSDFARFHQVLDLSHPDRPRPRPRAAPGVEHGRGPHVDPRSSVGARRQKAAFPTTGLVVGACGTAPPA